RLALKRFGPDVIDVVLREKLGAPSAGAALLGRFDRLCDELLPDDYATGHEFHYCLATKREMVLFDMFVEVFVNHRGDAGAVGPVQDFIRARAAAPRRRDVEGTTA